MIFEKSKRFRVELDRKAVGAAIARARRMRGWTQKDLAAAMGAALGTIVGWENGLRLPATCVLGTLANVLKRSLDFLLLNRGRNARHWKFELPPDGRAAESRSETGSAADPSAEASKNDSTPFSDPVGGSAGILADRAERGGE